MTTNRHRGLTEQAADTAVNSACRMLRLPTVRAKFPELAEAAGDKQLNKTIARYGRVDLLCIDELRTAARPYLCVSGVSRTWAQPPSGSVIAAVTTSGWIKNTAGRSSRQGPVGVAE
ncbi:hypothetical protein AB0D67_32975 [Streptosporangium sp. NPDC048047]|uniref:hypothetical protein n=1 Tax=Streptosporangium sp. NPDC048047 TaxID=3155748 RepID=UPI0034134662